MQTGIGICTQLWEKVDHLQPTVFVDIPKSSGREDRARRTEGPKQRENSFRLLGVSTQPVIPGTAASFLCVRGRVKYDFPRNSKRLERAIEVTQVHGVIAAFALVRRPEYVLGSKMNGNLVDLQLPMTSQHSFILRR